MSPLFHRRRAQRTSLLALGALSGDEAAAARDHAETCAACAERVELIGFEPTTSGLQSPRSPS